MRYVVSTLRCIDNIAANDDRYLLAVKFFLFYLFNEKPVVIKPTVDDGSCVLCTQGKNSRLNELNKISKLPCGTEEERHEIEFLKNRLLRNLINDTTITIPASIVVYDKNAVGRKLSEFDGMIIQPMRKSNNIAFLEAKNTSSYPSCGKKCLMEKFDKMNFDYRESDIKVIGNDTTMSFSYKIIVVTVVDILVVTTILTTIWSPRFAHFALYCHFALFPRLIGNGENSGKTTVFLVKFRGKFNV